MTAKANLLSQARDLLQSGEAHASRMACWLGRSALEDFVAARLEQHDVAVGDASMRSRISCLQALEVGADVQTAERVAYAWSRLSAACHQHAYELSPTAFEANHLLELVTSLLEADPIHASGYPAP